MSDISFHDWSISGTVEYLEKELVRFKFDGPGIYAMYDPGRKDGSLLVVPLDRDEEKTWHKALESPDEVFRVYVFDGRQVADMINLVARAPSRGEELWSNRKEEYPHDPVF